MLPAGLDDFDAVTAFRKSDESGDRNRKHLRGLWSLTVRVAGPGPATLTVFWSARDTVTSDCCLVSPPCSCPPPSC
ncbi:hypothetical protein GCM10010206_78890 [Streptomyces cinerochromogenes]|nr:hypothetical protein GCM10010206_78890 [Streptomyces cinerochromogenes]